MRLKVCDEECAAAKLTGWRDRRKHLLDCANMARFKGDDDAANKTLAIISREKDRCFWRKINYMMGKSRGRSVSMVQVEDTTGNIVEHTTQQTIHAAIWDEIHRKRFFLAEEAPICQGRLRGEFGYLLSESGLHFGHYRASAEEILLAQFHALKASLILKHGIVLDS